MDPKMEQPRLATKPPEKTALSYFNELISKKFNPIPGDIAECVSSDYFYPKEKIALAVMITRELTLAGRDTPTDIKSLATSYMNFLSERARQRESEASATSPEPVDAVQQYFKNPEEQANAGRWDYDLFCREHPYITIDGFQTASFRPEEVTARNQTFRIEHTIGINDRVAVLTAPDKEQDAIGVAKNPDGTINMAVADGVSNTVLPKFASRTAIQAALEDMRDKPPSTDTFRAAFDKIQQSDLTTMAINLDKSINEKGKAEQDLIKKQSLLSWSSKLKKLREKGSIAATTLALAKYDRQNSRLRIAVKGDSSVVVFKADGTYNVYQDPTNQQVHYSLQPTAQYSSEGEITQDLQLNPEDVILLCSDGAEDYPEIFENLNALITANRGKQGGDKLDYTATAYVKEQIRRGLGDDVSVIALHHKVAQ